MPSESFNAFIHFAKISAEFYRILLQQRTMLLALFHFRWKTRRNVSRISFSRQSNDSRHSFLASRGKRVFPRWTANSPPALFILALPPPVRFPLATQFPRHDLSFPLTMFPNKICFRRHVTGDRALGRAAVACRTFAWSYLPFTGKSLFTRVVRGSLDVVRTATLLRSSRPGNYAHNALQLFSWSGGRLLIIRFIKAPAAT